MYNNTGKCGCDCMSCPTFKDNIRTIEERRKCSAGWSKYLNIKLNPEKLRACDGCSLPDSDREVYYLNCSIRKCCMDNDIKNCAYCTLYPCEELKNVHSIVNIQSKEQFTELSGKSISDYDYDAFIEPYAGIKHLNEIRKNVKNSEIKDFKKHSVNIKFAAFPAGLTDSNESKSLKRIYSFLTSIGVLKDISYASLLSAKKRRDLLLKIIWTIALFGDFTETNSAFIELEAKIFTSQKIYRMYDVLENCFTELKKHKIYCEIIPLNTKRWLTPKGGLRDEGWKIIMSLGSDVTDLNTLGTFKKYVTELNDKYAKKAFIYFNKADLNLKQT